MRRIRQVSILVLVLTTPFVTAIWPFAPKRFTSNSLIDAGSLGLSDSGRVVAFGDLNGDQFMDVLMLDNDQRTLISYLWNHDKFVFEPSSSIQHPQKVINVVPGDFNNDGRLDLLVMSEGQGSNKINMAVYFSDLLAGFVSPPIRIPSSTSIQPMVVDSNGNMKIDLLGIPASLGGDNNSPLRLWKNTWNGTSGSSHLFDMVDSTLDSGKANICRLSQPHSNAFLDFDGDCLADIFLTCSSNMYEGAQSFQIWLNAHDDQGFYLGLSGQLPTGTGQITFADMDRDGTIDMVFPTCAFVDPSTGVGSDCMINIAYNKQLPLCASTTGSQKQCRSPQHLCTRDPNFQFDLTENASNDAFVRISLTSLFPSSPYLLMKDMTHDPPIPLPIRVGDFSLDGFPDIIPIVASAPRGGIFGLGARIDRTPYLLTSVPCARGVAGCGARDQGRRGFKVASTGSEALQQIVDARGVTVLDLDEDGTLDILVQRTGEQGSGTTLFVHNNFFYDAFFLKAMVLNSPCDGGGLCTMKNGTRYQGFGISYPGASYKYTVQDTSGRRSAAQVAQLPQTSFHSLQTPYSFFGLGRTNNYIENLFVGSTKKTDTFINMEGVIPNSKLIIVPSPQGEKYGWKRELFLRPGAWIPWVTLTVVLSTVIFAVVVFVLHLNEKREDELERRRASHHINFDAL